MVFSHCRGGREILLGSLCGDKRCTCQVQGAPEAVIDKKHRAIECHVEKIHFILKGIVFKATVWRAMREEPPQVFLPCLALLFRRRTDKLDLIDQKSCVRSPPSPDSALL